jgi:hypothetical protein
MRITLHTPPAELISSVRYVQPLQPAWFLLSDPGGVDPDKPFRDIFLQAVDRVIEDY